VNETQAGSLAKTKGQKNIFLHHETILIIGIILAAIIVISFLFSFLWTSFKFGFAILMGWLLIVITRKTDSWKMGIECYYILTFLFAFAFGPWLAFFLTGTALAFVVKVFRPDEVHGAITQMVGCTGIAFTTKIFVNMYSMDITKPQLLIAGMILFVVWDVARFLVALKVSPAHWVKLVASFITGVFVNYFYYSTFAFVLLKFLLSI
jgi:hypothetical protein